MPRFRYCRDALFLIGCAAYAINRWLITPRVAPGFMMFQFNDTWLIPCALPPVLWLHRRLGLRAHDDAPHGGEIAGHFIFWSALFEWIGPKFIPHAHGDPWDVAAYAAGAIVAGFWWNRHRWLPALAPHPVMSFDKPMPVHRLMERISNPSTLQSHCPKTARQISL